MSLALRVPEIDSARMASLREARLVSRNRGNLDSALISAGYCAKQTGTTMFVFEGESSWKVSCKSREYLSARRNFGPVVFEVTRELIVRKWHVKGRSPELKES